MSALQAVPSTNHHRLAGAKYASPLREERYNEMSEENDVDDLCASVVVLVPSCDVTSDTSPQPTFRVPSSVVRWDPTSMTFELIPLRPIREALLANMAIPNVTKGRSRDISPLSRPSGAGLPNLRLFCSISSTVVRKGEVVEVVDDVTVASQAQQLFLSRPLVSHYSRRDVTGSLSRPRQVCCSLHGPFGCHCASLSALSSALGRLRFEMGGRIVRQCHFEERLVDSLSREGQHLHSLEDAPFVGLADMANLASWCGEGVVDGVVMFLRCPTRTRAVIVLHQFSDITLPIPAYRRVLGPFTLSPAETPSHVMASLNSAPAYCPDEYNTEGITFAVPRCTSCGACGATQLKRCGCCGEYVCAGPVSSYSPSPVAPSGVQTTLPTCWMEGTTPSAPVRGQAPQMPPPSFAGCGRSCVYCCPSSTVCCPKCTTVEYSPLAFGRVFVCVGDQCRMRHHEVEKTE